MITVPNNFIPRWYQLPVFQYLDNCKAQGKPGRVIKRWHRRAGKDTADWAYMAKEAYMRPGNYFYIFPTSEDARRALWEKVDNKSFRTLHILPEEVAKFSNTEMKVTVDCFGGVGQSTIRVLGFDKNPDSLRGVSCAGAVVSEYAFSDPEVMKILMPAILESKGWLIINSTPNGKNHFFDLWESTDSDRWFKSELQTLWPDKPNYSGLESPETLQQLIDDGIETPDDVEREFGVSFQTAVKGSIYGKQLEEARLSERIGTFPYRPNHTVTTFFDIGQGDVTAIWFSQTNGSCIDFIDYWEGSGKGTDELAEVLLETGYIFAEHILPHDADHKRQGKTVKSFAEYFEESLRDFRVAGGTTVLDRTTDKNMSILCVKEHFSEYRFDSIKCALGLHHLEEYRRDYNKKTKVYSTNPRHDEHSNAADALRMEAESRNVRGGNIHTFTISETETPWKPW